jgi:hypothetical protein
MKLKLRIEDLAVVSFNADSEPDVLRGTVAANASDPNSCYPMVCYSGVESCIGTCVHEETCGLSCNFTCIPAYCSGEES